MIRNLVWSGLGLVVLGIVGAGPAQARNFHVSGGIQYVVQGYKALSKAEPDYEEANRVFNKAIVQLLEGIEEDPKDIEAWDYLGRAFAELDSSGRAGWAFASGIALAEVKTDKKKLLARMRDNRQHFWATYFSSALETFRIGSEGDDEAAAADSARAAIATMRRAIDLMPAEPRSFCNLVVFLMKVDDVDGAMAVVDEGLSVAPGDSCLIQRRENLTISLGEKAAESGEFETAIATFEKVIESAPDDLATAQRLGELYFQQATRLGEEERSAEAEDARKELHDRIIHSYAGAAKYFRIYHDGNTEDNNTAFNYGLALVRAENYGTAAEVLHAALLRDPGSADFHSLLGNAYRGLDLTDAATAHQLIAMILKNADVADDAPATAAATAEKWGARAEAKKFLADLGPPDEVRTSINGDPDIEAWFWWSRNRSVTMQKGRTVKDLDFTQLTVATSP